MVVEAPVLTYLARAYAFDQVPLILWKPGEQRVESLYYTVDAQAAVQTAAKRNGIDTVPVDTFTESAPEEDLLQGLLDLGDQIAAHQDCPRLRQAAVTGRAESHRPANGLRPGLRNTAVPSFPRGVDLTTRTKGAADRSPATACRGTPSPRTPPATRKLLVRCSPLDRTNKSTSGMAGWYR